MKIDLNRREFMQSTAAIGAGLFVANHAMGQTSGNRDTINVALIGAGAQGQILSNVILRMGAQSGVRFVAVCDIWEKLNLTRVSRGFDAYRAHGHKGTPYVDYKEMLDKEENLDAVIVASPDFWHAEHTIAALEKGCHVYCEKEMSNTIEGARRMVEAARKSGKLLQIGHQRRSNPRYQYSYEKYIQEAKLLGRITTINGQWNRSRAACEDLGWAAGAEIDEATLNKYGYKDMHQFRNWRWFKGLGGGPIVDLGSHQIDIYSWFLDANPKSVMASGGIDYWTNHEWYDNVMAIYEYETKAGLVRAFYQTLTTNSANGYYESFMGDQGTLVISEAANRGSAYRESWVEEDKWQPWVDKGYLLKTAGVIAEEPDEDAVLDLRTSVSPSEYTIPITMSEAYHQPHLVNFFDAIRGKAKLTCPAEVGFETAVTVLKVNEAVEKGSWLEFNPDEFTI
ncbi:MAG: Gfo/Idh/MocA family oxidoreductase [Phycisphaerae bacterium]|nr:Gfo/Idh/MocA family oxidoreductase [Phycisphaerae bacterium]